MKKIIFCTLSVMLLINVASATHLRGGHISIKQPDKTSRACRITITVYTNITSPVRFGGTQISDGDLLDFGDGTSPQLVPEIGSGENPTGSTYVVIDAAKGIACATYTVNHTYAAPGSYKVTYQEPNRNEGIINFDQSVSTPFYLESYFILDPFIEKAYSSPSFLVEPIFNVQIENDFSYSMAAQDSNDYSLLYELVSPKMSGGDDVLNYKLPDSFTINQFNGLINWDTQFQGFNRPGEYGFAVKIHQIQDNRIVGYVIRDFQIILEEADFTGTISDNRSLDENNRIYISSGNTYTFKVFAEDSEETSTEAFSELSSKPTIFSFTTYDSIQGARKIKVGVVSITNSPEILRDNPYAIVIRGGYRSDKYHKDAGYLFYTKDTELSGLEVILGVENEELSIKVYPNPTKDFLIIEGDDHKNKTIELQSVNGQLVLEKKNFKEDSIDLRSIPAGVYVLHIESGGFNRKTFRIIKTN